MVEDMDIDKGKAVAGDGPSTSGKNFDLPWVRAKNHKWLVAMACFLQVSCTCSKSTTWLHRTALLSFFYHVTGGEIPASAGQRYRW